ARLSEPILALTVKLDLLDGVPGASRIGAQAGPGLGGSGTGSRRRCAGVDHRHSRIIRRLWGSQHIGVLSNKSLTQVNSVPKITSVATGISGSDGRMANRERVIDPELR